MACMYKKDDGIFNNINTHNIQVMLQVSGRYFYGEGGGVLNILKIAKPRKIVDLNTPVNSKTSKKKCGWEHSLIQRVFIAIQKANER